LQEDLQTFFGVLVSRPVDVSIKALNTISQKIRCLGPQSLKLAASGKHGLPWGHKGKRGGGRVCDFYLVSEGHI
jgi:hypothetical protein